VSVSSSANLDFFHQTFEILTIDDSRKVQEIHASKPFSADIPRIFIIEMYGATREAQNALLKIIEEPQPGNFFFFVIPSIDILLPTVRSRVQIMEIARGVTDSFGTVGTDFITMPLGKRIAFVDALAADVADEKKAKHEAVSFLNAVERALHDLSGISTGTPAVSAGMSRDTREAFAAIARARDYANDRAPSLKMLLEYVALSLESILSNNFTKTISFFD
jgi:hypothetical protein